MALDDLLAPDDRGVLSVYFPLDPDDMTRRGFEARCTNAIHDARAHTEPGLSGPDREAAEGHVRSAVAAIGVPEGRSLGFLATPEGLRLQFSTALVLPMLGRFRRRPLLAPYWEADAAEPGGLAVLVDDTQAILFAVERHRALRSQRVADLVPARQKQGGWSQARYQRHRDHHVQEHHKHVAQEITARLHGHPHAWLALGGHPESVAALERELPGWVLERQAGAFNGQFHEPTETLEDYAYAVLREAQDRADLADLERTLDASAAGGRGAAGWGPVLEALAEGAVHELFCVREAATLTASRDRHGAISAVAVGQPSWSSGEPTVEPAELPYDAVQEAVQQGAALRVVRGAAADRLAQAGGVAAVLRHT